MAIALFISFKIVVVARYSERRKRVLGWEEFLKHKNRFDMAEMAEDSNYTRYTFGDTEFIVPSRYIELSARGTGAQGMVW